jgi:predicted transcriptional regulator
MQKKLSPSELEVLEVLWQSSRPLTSAEIMEELSKTRDWKPGTVWSFLGRLSEKGSLLINRAGKTNFYAPAYTREEYQRTETLEFIQTVHRGSLTSLYAALSQGDSLDEAAINELKQWLDAYGRS